MTRYLRMPVGFGPTGNPRFSPVSHIEYDPATNHKRFTAYARFKTTAEAIRKLLPPELEPTEEPIIVFEFGYMTEIQWLAGRGYNMLQVKVSAKTVDDFDGEAIHGWFQPVLWENMCEPIISGREDIGWPKIYAELPTPRHSDGRWNFIAAWDSFRFIELELAGLTATDTAPPGTLPLVNHKYIPAMCQPDAAEVDFLLVTPVGGPALRVIEHHSAQQAQLSINRARWEDMPTQFQIVNRLAEVPLLEVVQAGIFSSQGGNNLGNQHRIT